MIVDDHQIVAEGLSSMIEKLDHISVSGTANNYRECLSELERERPDILITDLNMPGKNGVPMIRELKERFITLKIIVLTMYFDTRLMKELEQCDIDGFLLKNSDKSDLIQAIETVSKGKKYKQERLNQFKSKHDFAISMGDEIKDSFARQYSLGNREIEVLMLVALGKNSQEIADALFISKETVSTHRKNLKRKIGLENTAQIAVFAVRNQLI